MPAAILLGDLVDSRLIEDREDFADLLRELLDILRQEHQGLRVSNSKGIDELTFLLPDRWQAPVVVARIAIGIYPQQMRFVAHQGEIDAALGRRPNEMDGPVFHEAAAAIARLKKTRRLFAEADHFDSPRSLLLSFCLHEIAGWSPAARRIAEMAWNQPALSQKQLAKHFNVTPSNISSALIRANFELVRDSIQSLTEHD